ncbi:glutamate ligase, partial [Salmonella enterica subsp. enterica]|nr:glutamate ligase [Salmonella enterica subsp. enterica serovar Enteritidis]
MTQPARQIDGFDDRLHALLERLHGPVAERVQALPAPWPGVVLFFSLCSGSARATTITATGDGFDDAWRNGPARLFEAASAQAIDPRWLRIDWVTRARASTFATLRTGLQRTKRNYFRQGLSIDAQFDCAFLEAELNANAMLYGGGAIEHAVVNEKNFRRYARLRHGRDDLSFGDDDPVHVFSTLAAFTAIEAPEVHIFSGVGLDGGKRSIDMLGRCDVIGLIATASDYLAGQVNDDGRFNYGWHPCFDRPISTYNSLRHASTVYAMIEAYEATRSPRLLQAIERALRYLVGELIVDAPDAPLSFVIEANGELKLGASAAAILALVKYSEIRKTTKYHDLLERLALGIVHMQDPASGAFSHVLNYPSLEVKDPFRIIYYDGEAAFGLMRLFGLTRDARWLEAVERAFVHFLKAEHWKAHDHWLAYAANELAKHCPKAKYFEFGIRNVEDYLDFVRLRITTFP